MDLQIGSTIGDYQVLEVLGAGGMGSVYKVRNQISDRVEALKVLLPDLTGQPELAERFQREIKVQGSLDHPNIAQLRTAFRSGNQLLMVMEFVDGVTLEKLVQSGPMPVRQALDAIGQVLSALEFAHGHGVIHRDIKPANIILTRTGVIKLMDFGIAKAASDNKLTMTGTTMGSIYYMSPEQIQGAANLDARADLYSVGVTLYQLVTGKRPFEGDSQYAIMAAHLQTTPVPPVEIDPRLPQALNDVILMSVAKDPNLRFQTALAFRNALGGVASTLPASAAAVTAPSAPIFEPPPVPAPTQPPRQIPTVASVTAPSPVPPAMPPYGQPAAPQFAPAAAMMPQPPQPVRSKSRRGLWMALGGVAAAAAIIAAIEFVPWKGVKADNARQQAAANTQAQQPAATPAQTPPQTPATDSSSSQPVEVVASATPATGGGSATPTAPSGSSAARQPQPKPGGTGSGTSANPPPQTTKPSPSQPQADPTTPQAPPQPTTAQPGQTGQPTQQAGSQSMPPTPAGPSREEIMRVRERVAKLRVRVDAIRSSLMSLRRSQQSMGMNLNAKYTQPEGLMTTYMQAVDDALNSSDLKEAREYAGKAEHQIEILEKLLNL